MENKNSLEALLNARFPGQVPKGVMFIDYDNIYNRFKAQNINPQSVKLFATLKSFWENQGLVLVDIKCYANFDSKELHESYHQSYLAQNGIKAIHAATAGKNCSDIMLVCDALEFCFTDPDTQVFIIISCDRDFVPLMQSLKRKHKLVVSCSLKTDINEEMPKFADAHIYLESLLSLDNAPTPNMSVADYQAVKEIMRVLMASKIWQKHLETGEDVEFYEMLKHFARARRLLVDEVERLFLLADDLKWLNLDSKQRHGHTITVIKQGPGYADMTAEFKKT